jgi:hypothetical protein
VSAEVCGIDEGKEGRASDGGVVVRRENESNNSRFTVGIFHAINHPITSNHRICPSFVLVAKCGTSHSVTAWLHFVLNDQYERTASSNFEQMHENSVNLNKIDHNET